MNDKEHIIIGTELHKNTEEHLKKIENERKKQIYKFKNLMNEYHESIGILKTNKFIDDIPVNIQTDIEEILLKILPHGSGIDCNWEFEFFNNGSIKCKNFFHAMNNNGYYVKYIPISIKFFRHKKNEYNFFADKTKCQIIKLKDKLDYKWYAPNCDYYAYDLNDYLYQTVWYLDILTKNWYLKIIDKK